MVNWNLWNTWHCSNSTKCSRITIHDTGIRFYMSIHSQIWASPGIGARIILFAIMSIQCCPTINSSTRLIHLFHTILLGHDQERTLNKIIPNQKNISPIKSCEILLTIRNQVPSSGISLNNLTPLQYAFSPTKPGIKNTGHFGSSLVCNTLQLVVPWRNEIASNSYQTTIPEANEELSYIDWW